MSTRTNGVDGGRSRKRVLVADHNAESRARLIAQLARIGSFQVDEAANGRETLERSKQHRPDLILMAMNMPLMDGYQATKNIRATRGDVATVPIIALTNGCVSGELARCARAGVSDFLVDRGADAELFRSKVLFWSALGYDLALRPTRLAANARRTNGARLHR